MKTLYYTDACYGQMFWDKDCNFVSYIQENDGNFRQEYMSFIGTFFEGKIKYANVKLTDEERWDEEDLSPQEYFDKYKDKFKAATK